MGGSEHIAHIRVIQVLPVADNWIDEDEGIGMFASTFRSPPTSGRSLGICSVCCMMYDMAGKH